MPDLSHTDAGSPAARPAQGTASDADEAATPSGAGEQHDTPAPGDPAGQGERKPDADDDGRENGEPRPAEPPTPRDDDAVHPTDPKPEPQWMSYQVGQSIGQRTPISQIPGHDRVAIVWTTSKAGLWFEYDPDACGPEARTHIAYAKKLHLRLKTTVRRGKREPLTAYVASALYGAFVRCAAGGDVPTPEQQFADAEELIETVSKESSHYWYLMSGTVAAAFILTA